MKEFILLGNDDIEGKKQLEIFKICGTKAEISDYAILLGGSVYVPNYNSNNDIIKDRVGLLMDLDEVNYRIENLRMLGSKGTTGTQASFMELFDGDDEKIKRMEQMIADDFGFAGVVPVSGQTVIGGGPCAYNPEPLAVFFDLFYMGEGETLYDEIFDLYKENKKQGGSRKDFLEKAAESKFVRKSVMKKLSWVFPVALTLP